MAVKTFSVNEVLTAADTNTFLANAGLVYIDGGFVSGQATFSKDGVFTSTYANYRLILTQMRVQTAARAFRLNYRSSNSTNIASEYSYAYLGYKIDGTTNNTNNVNTTFAEVGVYLDSFANTDFGSATIDIMSPQLGARTHALVAAQGYEGNYYYRQGGFVYRAETAFDGFHISLSGTGNLAFSWRLYGYRQA